MGVTHWPFGCSNVKKKDLEIISWAFSKLFILFIFIYNYLANYYKLFLKRSSRYYFYNFAIIPTGSNKKYHACSKRLLHGSYKLKSTKNQKGNSLISAAQQRTESYANVIRKISGKTDHLLSGLSENFRTPCRIIHEKPGRCLHWFILILNGF